MFGRCGQGLDSFASLFLLVTAGSSQASQVAVQAPAPPAVPRWGGTSHKDLHREYRNIFKHGSRNAASHLWSNFILERSSQMTHATLVDMFSGFCAVSGSTVRPSDYTRYKLTLDKVDGTGKTTGYMMYCCWPCVCDTQDFIKIDTKNVTTADGVRTYRFAVLGNPCNNAEALRKPFVQPFGRGTTTLAQSAAEVRCDNGVLLNAPLSDHGYIIISMFFDFPDQSADSGWLTAPQPVVQAAKPGRISSFSGVKYQDEHEYGPMCANRAANGYNSGMGEIFRKVASISPIVVPTKNCSDSPSSNIAVCNSAALPDSARAEL